MKPVTKRSSTLSGAKWLRRAERLAQSLEKGGRFATVRELQDGYLLQGRRVGDRYSATVIDLPGRIGLVGPYDGMVLASIDAPDRDFFSPLLPLRDSADFGERVPAAGNAFVIGPPPAAGAATMAHGHAWVGGRSVFLPTVIYTGSLTSAGLPTVQTWLRVLTLPVGAGPAAQPFFIHQSVLQGLAPGYDTVPRIQASAVEWGSLPIACGCVFDGMPVIALQMYREETPPGATASATKIIQGVLAFAVDLVERQIAWSAFLPAEDMPADFQPVPISNGSTVNTFSQASFFHLQGEVSAAGMRTVGYYAVERPDNSNPAGLSVVPAFGVAVMDFAPGVASVSMVHTDVRAPASSPLVATYAGDSGYVLRPLLPRVVGGEPVVEAYQYQRAADWGWPSGGPDFRLQAPYSRVFHGGTQVATATSLGSMERKDQTISGDIGTLFNPSQMYAHLGLDVIAYEGREIDSRALGVTFVSATAAKFEQLVPTYAGTVIGELISVTCPQMEVRNEEGALVVPCVLLALFSTGPTDDFFLGVRKGPIWPEDEAGAVEDHWRFYPMQTWAQLGGVYLGNPLSTAEYGQMFRA